MNTTATKPAVLVLSGIASESHNSLLAAVRDIAGHKLTVIDVELLKRGFCEPAWCHGKAWSAHHLAELVTACLSLRLTVTCVEADRIFLTDPKGMECSLQVADSGVQEAVLRATAVDGYGPLIVARLCRTEWGGGIAGGNVCATKGAVACWNAVAAIRYMFDCNGVEV